MKISGRRISYQSAEFCELYKRLYPSMCVVAFNFVKDRDSAEDIVQEAFIKLCENKDEEFKHERALRAYLYVIVRNTALTFLQTKKRFNNDDGTLEISEETDFFKSILQEETHLLIREAISQLAPRNQKIIELSLEGLSNLEIAQELDISVNTVKTLKKRAYKFLREKLAQHLVTILTLISLSDFLKK